MSCEHLICARCAGPVAEGRCPTCREARAHVHHQHSHTVSVQLIAAVLLILALLTVAAMHLGH